MGCRAAPPAVLGPDRARHLAHGGRRDACRSCFGAAATSCARCCAIQGPPFFAFTRPGDVAATIRALARREWGVRFETTAPPSRSTTRISSPRSGRSCRPPWLPRARSAPLCGGNPFSDIQPSRIGSWGRCGPSALRHLTLRYAEEFLAWRPHGGADGDSCRSARRGEPAIDDLRRRRLHGRRVVGALGTCLNCGRHPIG